MEHLPPHLRGTADREKYSASKVHKWGEIIGSVRPDGSRGERRWPYERVRPLLRPEKQRPDIQDGKEIKLRSVAAAIQKKIALYQRVTGKTTAWCCRRTSSSTCRLRLSPPSRTKVGVVDENQGRGGGLEDYLKRAEYPLHGHQT